MCLGAIGDFIGGPIFGDTGDAKDWNDQVTNWKDTQNLYNTGASSIQNASDKAVANQSDLLDKALREQGLGLDAALAYSQPYIKAGGNAMTSLQNLSGPTRELLTALALRDSTINQAMASNPAMTDQDLAAALQNRNQIVGNVMNGASPDTTALVNKAIADRDARTQAIIDRPITEDAAYTALKDLGTRNLNQQLAARGKYFSGRAVDEGTRNLESQLTADLFDRTQAAKQNEINNINAGFQTTVDNLNNDYNRDLTNRQFQVNTANSNYDATRTTVGDMINRNLANQQFKVNTANTGYGLTADTLNSNYDKSYTRLKDLKDTGAQFAAGNASMINSNAATKAGLYSNAANKISDSYTKAGESLATMYSNLGNLRYENSAGKHMLSLWGGQ